MAIRSATRVCSLAVIAACFFPDPSPLGQGLDAGDGGDAAVPSGVIANAGHVTAATGNAQQTHVIYAVGAKRWWLFYIDDDPMTLKTRSSSDFVTWADGPALALTHPNAGEGRNFSVAYANLGGTDVVHVSLSHVVGGDAGPLVHSHARGVIGGDTLTFASPADVSMIDAGPAGPDSPVTFINADGTVWDSTGFVISQNTTSGIFNEDVFSSPADNGATWTATFTQTTVERVKNTVNARAFLNAGGLGAIWTSGDQVPDPTNLHFSEYTPTTWGAPFSIFDDAGAQDPNDWGVATLSTTQGAEGHVVRALLAGGYQHAYGTGGNGSNASAPPTQARVVGNGVLLLADPTHLGAIVVTPAGALVLSRWNGSTWSAWSMVAAATSRAYLSGYCPDLDAHPEAGGCAVIWTATTSGGSTIGGQLVTVR